MSVDTKKRVLIIANELSPYTEFTDFAQILNQAGDQDFRLWPRSPCDHAPFRCYQRAPSQVA
jgi:hypothetical protein